MDANITAWTLDLPLIESLAGSSPPEGGEEGDRAG